MDSIHIAFMVAGHTKFDPDRMFSAIANGYNRSDIFNIDELQALCQLYTTAEVSDGSNVFPWREFIKEKTTDFSGTHKYHGYLTSADHRGAVVMKVREHCHKGEFKNSPMRLIQTSSTLGKSYYHTQRRIPASKLGHIKTMCKQYIAEARWPVYAK